MDKPFDLEELWSIFGEESKENLDLVETCLLKLESAPDDAELVAALFRSMHTVKGGARMMGLSVLESLAHRAEDLVSLVRDEGYSIDAEMIALLLAVLDHLRLLLDEVLAQHQDVEPVRVEAQVRALVEMAVRRRSGSASTAAAPDVAVEPVEVLPAPDLETVEPATVKGPPEADQAGCPCGEANLPQVERIDLSTDPVSVRIFFEMAEEELNSIGSGLRLVLAGDDSQSAERVSASADSLAYAASQMGFHQLEQAAQNLFNALQSLEDEKDRLRVLAQAVEQEMAVLRRRYGLAAPEPNDPPVPESLPPEPQDLPAEGPTSSGISAKVLESLMETIGEMAGDQTTLHHLLTRIYYTDLVSDVHQIIKTSGGDAQVLSRRLDSYLGRWTEAVAAAVQAENRVNASLNHLQELCGELGVSLDRTIVDGMVVRVGRVYYMIPISAVRRIASISADTLVRSSADGHGLLICIDDQMLPVYDLSAAGREVDPNQLVVVIDSARGSLAVRVDELLGQQRLLVLPLKGQFMHVRHAVGCVLLGDGEVGMVLNPDSIEVSADKGD